MKISYTLPANLQTAVLQWTLWIALSSLALDLGHAVAMAVSVVLPIRPLAISYALLATLSMILHELAIKPNSQPSTLISRKGAWFPDQ